MTWISKSTTGFGLVLLAHACYSVQEFTSLQSLQPTASPQAASAALPADIVIETIAALLVASLGLVLGTQDLKPIRWHVWAGKIEREGKDELQNSSGDVDKDYVGNPFRYLETRPGFTDIRKQRTEFGDWARMGGGAQQKKA
ncbi:Magnesium transporter [Niveomyces insectorum RCEF 264]|uniref:Magnesium transporter n=1 Tax=Niveomyces insectorum RCEF 264 TaxID=1081102 RepID=A0A167U106_9HYPO|nr:Magnesium transporter [Niveomyces insectorum RCEF 264]